MLSSSLWLQASSPLLTQQRNIRYTEEQAAQARQQRVAVGFYGGVVGVDQYLLKEGVNRLAQGGQTLQSRLVLALGCQRRYSLLCGLYGAG